MTFHKTWIYRKSHVSKIFLSTMTGLNYGVFSYRPSILNSSRPFIKRIVPRTPTTVGITVIFLFHRPFYLYYYSLIRAFLISDSRWIFTGVWVTASLLKSPGLFSVFWLFSIMLSFGWSPLVRQLPSPPVPFSNPLVTVPNAPITIGIIVTFMFHSFSIPLQGRGTYPSFHILLVLFCGQLGQHSPQSFKFSFLLLIITRSGLLAEIWWSVCMSKSQRSLCGSFSRTGAGLCIYYLFVWSNSNFLHISQWITLPTQPCLVIYSFRANLLHLLIMWLMVSSLSPHSLHLLFCCVLFILALIWLVLSVFSCAAISRNSVSL